MEELDSGDGGGPGVSPDHISAADEISGITPALLAQQLLNIGGG